MLPTGGVRLGVGGGEAERRQRDLECRIVDSGPNLKRPVAGIITLLHVCWEGMENFSRGALHGWIWEENWRGDRLKIGSSVLGFYRAV